MSLILKYLTYILTAIILILLALNFLKFKEKDQRLDELNRINILFRDSLSRSADQRTSLLLTIDSLNTVSQSLSSQLVHKDREIQSIKGRYNNINQDSLGALMDARARKSNR